MMAASILNCCYFKNAWLFPPVEEHQQGLKDLKTKASDKINFIIPLYHY